MPKHEMQLSLTSRNKHAPLDLRHRFLIAAPHTQIKRRGTRMQSEKLTTQGMQRPHPCTWSPTLPALPDQSKTQKKDAMRLHGETREATAAFLPIIAVSHPPTKNKETDADQKSRKQMQTAWFSTQNNQWPPLPLIASVVPLPPTKNRKMDVGCLHCGAKKTRSTALPLIVSSAESLSETRATSVKRRTHSQKGSRDDGLCSPRNS